jgi:ribosome-binding protein aMBF1 (putative translation factor)
VDLARSRDGRRRRRAARHGRHVGCDIDSRRVSARDKPTAAMNTKKRKHLEAAGWRVGTAAEFLGLDEQQALLVELKLALADAVRARRTKLGLTQQALARRLGSSQSRVAKLESADPSVSMDLLVTALLGLGATRRELAKIVGSRA